MSILLHLSSAQAIANNSSNRSDDFLVNFSSPIVLEEKKDFDWYVQLVSANIWNSVPNISQENYQNATFEISRDGIAFETIIIPEGTYGIEALDDFLHSELDRLGWYKTDSTGKHFYDFSFVPNYSRLTIEIFVADSTTAEAPDPTIRLLAGFAKILGFSGEQLFDGTMTAEARTSTQKVNISNDVDTISINLDLISSSHLNDQPSSALTVYSPDVAPGALVQIKPNIQLPVKVNDSVIRYLRVFMRDSLGRRVDYRGENVEITVQFLRLPA